MAEAATGCRVHANARVALPALRVCAGGCYFVPACEAIHPDMFLLARCVILSAQTRAERQSVSLCCGSKDVGGGDWLARRQVPWHVAPVLLVIAWWRPAAMPQNRYPFGVQWQGLAKKMPLCVMYRWS